jgi:hypothetical protein
VEMMKELKDKMKVKLKITQNSCPLFQLIRVSHAKFATDHFQANRIYETTKLYIQENEVFRAQ